MFTPGGDVINLPAGATPIDFAYNIHSAVGNHMTGATVNGRIVPFNHVLQNGDIVEIITSNSSKGPSRDWMNIVKSSAARTKIRQWFKKEKRDENIVQGKASFEAELKRAGLTMSDITAEEVLPNVLKRVGFPSLDELFATIGYGGLTALRAVNRVRDEVMRNSKAAPKSVLERMNSQKPPTKSIHGIIVEGLDNCLVKFSRCCTPVPGDGVVGFITRGYGVSVHRADCPNYLNSREKPEEKDRWIKVEWAPATSEYYQTTLVINARDRNGLFMDLATVLNSVCSKVRSMSARDTHDGNAVAFISLEVKDLVELRNIMAKLQAVSGVIDVKRTGR